MRMERNVSQVRSIQRKIMRVGVGWEGRVREGRQDYENLADFNFDKNQTFSLRWLLRSGATACL